MESAITSVLVDVGRRMKREQLATTSQIERQKSNRERGVLLEVEPRALAGFVRLVLLTATPVASTQGELNVGSVIPKPKFSSSRVCFRSIPNLML